MGIQGDNPQKVLAVGENERLTSRALVAGWTALGLH